MDRYIYIGAGDYIIGLPTRDIDKKEWENYPKELTDTALKSGLYELEKHKLEISEVENA